MLLLLHLVLLGWPLSEAHAGPAIDPHVIPHLTVPGGDDCPLPHNDLSCYVCRTLHGMTEPGSCRVRLGRAATLRRLPVPPVPVRLVHAPGLYSPVGPRAPPSA